MFDNLKKKFSSFINNIASKSAEQTEAGQEKEIAKPTQEVISDSYTESEKSNIQVFSNNQIEANNQNTSIALVEDKVEIKEEKIIHKKEANLEDKTQNKQIKVENSPIEKPISKTKLQEKDQISSSKHVPTSSSVSIKETNKLDSRFEKTSTAQIQKSADSSVNLSPKLGIFAKVKNIFNKETILSQKELDPVFDNLETALLESDVTPSTALELIKSLKSKLEGIKVENSKINEFVRIKIKESLIELFIPSDFNLIQTIKEHSKSSSRPYVIVLLGPNGAGKTTTGAKLAKKLLDSNISVLISASDTFRKAAIEQAVIHGNNLNIKVIKQDYGADPTAVAFDSINSAISSKTNCVIIDTAGRQETNSNLLREMEKMQRIIKPDLKIFVGEALTGHSLIDQAKKFKETIGFDGFILTKLDCDSKGGISLSLGYEVQSPIYYLGIGQNYDDLIEFNSEWLVTNIIGASKN